MFIPVVVLFACMTNLNAQDWPQLLGPDRNGVSAQKGIIRSWPQQGPEVLWTTGLGIGYGGPAVKDGKVYLLDRDDKVGDKLRCFDLSSGKELWSFAYDAPGSVMFPGSRCVPTVDGNYVYSCGPYGHLYCIDINTHKPVWNKNIWSDYGGGDVPTWAITQCPLVYGNLLIIASQAPEAGVVAYDKLTGNVKWKTPSLGATGYVSPSIVKIGGEDHVVMVTASVGGRPARPSGQGAPPAGAPPAGAPPRGAGAGAPPQGAPGQGSAPAMGKIIGIKPLTGEILWEYANWECRIPVAGAVDAGEGRVLVVGGYELGTVMIRVEKKAGDGYNVTELFKHVNFGGHTLPPILYNGYFYSQYSTNNRRDGLVCMSMDGKIMWKTQRAPSFDKGSMILAEGLILATDGANTLYLIEPDPSGFKPVASAKLLAVAEGLDTRFSTQNWAPVALSDGRLLIRDQSRLMCVRVAK